MSVDIGIQIFKDGGAGHIPRALIEQLFRNLTKNPEEELWYLTAPDGENTWGTLLIDQEPEISGFSINRPPFGVDEFLDAIFEVLRQTVSILWWPNDGICVCGVNPEVLSHAPPEILDPKLFVMISTVEEMETCLGLPPRETRH